MPEANQALDFLADDVADLEKEIAQSNPKEQEPQQVETVPPDQEAPPTPDIDAVDGEDRGQFIRKAALYEERQRRKEATERSRQWEQRYTEDMRRANDRLQALFENAQGKLGQAPNAQTQKQAPSIDEDPIGHFQAQNEELRKTVADQVKWRDQVEQKNKYQDDAQRLSYEVTRLETEFAAKVPDYYKAHEHLVSQWTAEARAMRMPEQDIAEAVRSRSIETVQIAARLNRNPAEIAYERAKAVGYRPGQTQQAQQPQQQANRPNLDTISRGMATAKSASATSGTAAAGIPTIEALLSMPEDEFASKYGSSDNKTWDREMKRIMGIT